MKRVPALVAAVISITCTSTYAIDLISNEGLWPKSWPKELDSLRKRSRTIDGGLTEWMRHEIPFTNREDFESAWPHLLKVKSKGAPVMLFRGPHKFRGATMNAGVRVFMAVPKESRYVSAVSIPGQTDVRLRWMSTTFIELVVDEEIVDLNRIPLPAESPIIDRRFEQGDSQ